MTAARPPGEAYELPTVAHTRAFGEALAPALRPGDLVVLSGPLGAGKTALAQGIGAGLGVAGQVTSPTFVIARVHRGSVPMVHVDLYRLGGAPDPGTGAGAAPPPSPAAIRVWDEVDDLDLDAELDDAVLVVEWGEGMVEHLAEAHLLVRIDRRDDEVRVVELHGRGGDWAQRLAPAAAR